MSDPNSVLITVAVNTDRRPCRDIELDPIQVPLTGCQCLDQLGETGWVGVCSVERGDSSAHLANERLGQQSHQEWIGVRHPIEIRSGTPVRVKSSSDNSCPIRRA